MSCRHPIKNPCIFVHYLSDQLHQIMAHIEDLMEINSRVERAELTKAYHDPQVSASQDI